MKHERQPLLHMFPSKVKIFLGAVAAAISLGIANEVAFGEDTNCRSTLSDPVSWVECPIDNFGQGLKQLVKE